MEAITPRWWKPLKIVTFLGCVVWPLLFFMSIFVFDSGADYYLKVYIVSIVDSYPLWAFPLSYLALWIYRRTRSNIAGLSVCLIPVVLLFGGCVYYFHGALPKFMYQSDDHRLYWNTPASDLADAIIADDTVRVHEILEKSPELAGYSDESHGQSMLSYAFERGSFASVRELICMGADVNECSKSNGETLLHRLCNGVDVEVPEGLGVIVKSVMPQSYLNLMEWILENGADVNQATGAGEWAPREGLTPLQYLCLHGPDSPQALDVLLKYGAEIGVTRKNHEDKDASPLADAIYSCKCKIATKLMQSGCERDSVSRQYLEFKKDHNKGCYDVWQIFIDANSSENL